MRGQRSKIEIDYVPLSEVRLYFGCENKYGKMPTMLYINLDDNRGKSVTCHELGHIYTSDRATFQNFYEQLFGINGNKVIRGEVIAWRIAKSIIKPKYWSEKYAIECLKTYFEANRKKINISKLKIIPYNKGKWLNKK